jgi:hypothetical protein
MVSEVLQVLPSFGSSSSADGISAGGSMKDIRQINNIPFYFRACKDAINEAAVGITKKNRGEVTKFSFLGGTFLEKFIDNKCTSETKKVIKGLDKSLIDSKISQNAIENLFDCKIQANNAGKLVLTASEEAIKAQPLKLAAGKLASDVLGVTTRFGLLASGVTEAPDLYNAYENGDLGKQTIRSTSKIGISSVAFGTIAHIGKEFAPKRLKTLVMIGGAVAGSIMSCKATDTVLDKVMGKSIKAQKAEAKKYLAELKKQRALQGA